jgi:4-diphosphocytidyl-2-C-methyl-D-erythritol kinase
MLEAQSFLAPAKINLFLHIVGVRKDGYHLLQTVFRLINHYDTIYLKVRQQPEIKRIYQENDPLKNTPPALELCTRAATLLQQYTGCKLGVEIAVDKKIAMGAGLGGGSSDAATVLLALNRLWKLNLNRSELIDLGLQIGADVPFFLFGQNAWAEGIGEQLSPISLGDAYYVVLNPKIHVSTAQIFANKELTKDAFTMKMSDFSGQANFSENNKNAQFTNALEKVVCNKYPAILDSLNWLRQYGDARMSGSGASVFLAVADKKTANEILSNKPNDIDGFVAKGLNQHPLMHYAD